MTINIGLISMVIALPLYFWLYFQLNKCVHAEDRLFGKIYLTLILFAAICFSVYAMYKGFVIDISSLITFPYSETVSERYNAISK